MTIQPRTYTPCTSFSYGCEYNTLVFYCMLVLRVIYCIIVKIIVKRIHIHV